MKNDWGRGKALAERVLRQITFSKSQWIVSSSDHKLPHSKIRHDLAHSPASSLIYRRIIIFWSLNLFFFLLSFDHLWHLSRTNQPLNPYYTLPPREQIRKYSSERCTNQVMQRGRHTQEQGKIMASATSSHNTHFFLRSQTPFTRAKPKATNEASISARSPVPRVLLRRT